MLKKYFHELLTLHSSPQEIALGACLGTLIGVLPTPGISLVLALIVLFVFPKASKIALLASIAFWNPLLTIPLGLVSYTLGRTLVETSAAWQYLLGNAIISVGLAGIVYLLVYVVASRREARKKGK